MHQAESVRDAWESPPLFESDLVLVDHLMPGGPDFVGAVGESTGARVIVCSSHCSEEAVLAALQAGAVGVLRKDTLTTDSLASAVRAAVNGTGVVTAGAAARPARRARRERPRAARPGRASPTASSRSSR